MVKYSLSRSLMKHTICYLVTCLLIAPLYIFYGSTAIAIQLSLSFVPWSILAIITPPDSVRKTVLVNIDYINYNIYLYFLFSIFLYRAAILAK